MTKDEALLMAIESMQFEDKSWECEHGFNHNECPNEHCIEKNWFATIQACKKALEQEPLNLKCKSVQKRLATQWGYVDQPAQEPVAFDCKNCHACLKGVKGETGYPITMTRMIVCPDCGNKRCPKATDHRHFCTNSNDTNQAGSIYNTHSAPSWVGLSDDENEAIIESIWVWGNDFPYEKYRRAIETKLKEKNT